MMTIAHSFMCGPSAEGQLLSLCVDSELAQAIEDRKARHHETSLVGVTIASTLVKTRSPIVSVLMTMRRVTVTLPSAIVRVPPWWFSTAAAEAMSTLATAGLTLTPGQRLCRPTS
jgi:hypothetical protein